MWDREQELLIWRGVAADAFNRDYHGNEAKITKALGKLAKQWKKTLSRGTS